MAKLTGHLNFRAVPRADGQTVLKDQSFRAPFHLSKPYWDSEARILIVQVVNPTAGILAGDELEVRIEVERGSALIVTTPGASRVFTMRHGAAVARQQISVADGAWLEWIPEPLVTHRESTFRQITRLELDASAAVFYADQWMPGRLGHGEAWAWRRLELLLEVWQANRLVLCERMAASGHELQALAALHGSGPEACFLNAVLAGPALGPTEGTWRTELERLQQPGIWIGVSGLAGQGAWTLKVVTENARRLRETVRAIRAALAPHLPYLATDLRKL
jgi:urease accessory protein